MKWIETDLQGLWITTRDLSMVDKSTFWIVELWKHISWLAYINPFTLRERVAMDLD